MENTHATGQNKTPTTHRYGQTRNTAGVPDDANGTRPLGQDSHGSPRSVPGRHHEIHAQWTIVG
eukprot:36948-Rhodomonas_salina.1